MCFCRGAQEGAEDKVTWIVLIKERNVLNFFFFLLNQPFVISSRPFGFSFCVLGISSKYGPRFPARRS